MSKFKVGDKVKIVESVYQGLNDLGRVGKVSACNMVEVGFSPKSHSVVNEDNFCLFFDDSQLQLVKDSTVKFRTEERLVSLIDGRLPNGARISYEQPNSNSIDIVVGASWDSSFLCNFDLPGLENLISELKNLRNFLKEKDQQN